jgi:nitroreductase
MKQTVRAILKKVYYKGKCYAQSMLLPDAYKYEMTFIESIRANTYSDIYYKEARLKSIAHALDKTLSFNKFKEMDSVVKAIMKSSSEIAADQSHDPDLIAWCNNIIAEYKKRALGNPASDVDSILFDNHDVAMLKTVIETRRSIRSFKSNKIGREKIDEILKAGLWAPSGCNRQSIEFLFLENKEDIKYCQRIAGEGNPFPQEASCAVVILADPRNYALPSQRHMGYLEGGAAIQNMLLMAHCLGVGACWLFWSGGGKSGHRDFVTKFKLDPWLLPVSMVCFGYPDVKPKYSPVRNKLDKVTHESQKS